MSLNPSQACKVSLLSSLLYKLFVFSVVMGDINPRDNEGMTPVHCAAQLGRPKHILLLNEGKFCFNSTTFFSGYN